MTKNWAENKEHILRYYQQQGQSLTNVMKVMKGQHNFQASQRAYRQQFQKWAIFKYNRKSRDVQLGHTRPARYPQSYQPTRAHYGAYPQSAYSTHRTSLPLPKLEHAVPYPSSQSMSYPSTTLARLPLPQTPPSPASAAYSTDHYDPYKALDTKSAYHDNDAHHSIGDRPYSDGSASPYKAHYPALQHSLHGQSVPYAQAAYHTPVSPLEPSAAELSSDSVPRYASYGTDCCSHSQGSAGHGAYHGSVPMSNSGSQTSLSSHASHGSHGTHASGSSPSTHDSLGHSAYSPSTTPGSYTTTLPSQNHTHMLPAAVYAGH